MYVKCVFSLNVILHEMGFCVAFILYLKPKRVKHNLKCSLSTYIFLLERNLNACWICVAENSIFVFFVGIYFRSELNKYSRFLKKYIVCEQKLYSTDLNDVQCNVLQNVSTKKLQKKNRIWLRIQLFITQISKNYEITYSSSENILQFSRA